MLYKIIAALALSFLLVGCKNIFQPIRQTNDYLNGKVQVEEKKQADRTLAMVKCQKFCQNQLSNDNSDFGRGPCLSNAIIPDWVCDIVHFPRQPIDDDPKNQCSVFIACQGHHFVEVDGNCNLIRAN